MQRKKTTSGQKFISRNAPQFRSNTTLKFMGLSEFSTAFGWR